MVSLRLRVVAIALAGVLPPAAAVDEPSRITQWNCWSDAPVRILCRLKEAASGAEHPEALTELPAVGRRAPSGRMIRTSALAREILETPARLQRRTISIPLFGSQCTRAAAAELAENVMCGGKHGCEVTLLSPPEAIFLEFDEFEPSAEE